VKEVLIGVAVRSSRLVTLDRAGPIVMRRPTDGLALGTLADYKARTGQDPVRGVTTTGGRATVTVPPIARLHDLARTVRPVAARGAGLPHGPARGHGAKMALVGHAPFNWSWSSATPG